MSTEKISSLLSKEFLFIKVLKYIFINIPIRIHMQLQERKDKDLIVDIIHFSNTSYVQLKFWKNIFFGSGNISDYHKNLPGLAPWFHATIEGDCLGVKKRLLLVFTARTSLIKSKKNSITFPCIEKNNVCSC